MKPKINIRPGVVIFVLGIVGLVISLAENSGQVGGKVPLALFFLFIIGIGVMIEMKMKEDNLEVFGEREGVR